VIRIAVYYLVLTLVTLYAGRRGGAPERVAAGVLVSASLATSALPVHLASYHTVEWAMLGIDAAVLIGLLLLAATADRFWPIWVAAVQLIAVAVHGIRSYDPHVFPIVYARLAGELAYPILFMVAGGVWRHVRRAPERDWSWQSLHAERECIAREH
jgi:hypothetical protein